MCMSLPPFDSFKPVVLNQKQCYHLLKALAVFSHNLEMLLVILIGC